MTGTALAVAVGRAGGVMLPDRGDGWINRIQIPSETSTRLYVVSQNTKQGNRFECSCPAWRTRRRCKHLDTMKPLLERMAMENGASSPPSIEGTR